MSVVDVSAPASVPRLDLELISGCDHACGHCYNVWDARPGDPQSGYDTTRPPTGAAYLALVDKALAQTGCAHVTITGGEPLLRRDALDVIERVAARVETVTLITNGSHVTEAVADRLAAARVRQVQLTLLAAERALHDRLKGAVCFDDTVRAAVRLVERKVPVQICFVAMRENAHTFEDVLRLCDALGVRGVSYNRMSPTGGAIHHVARLMPTIEQIEANLAVAETVARALDVRVSTAMPIPPCLVRIERYPWVQFGFCSTGTDAPNLVMDPKGNLRSCNLSSGVLGSLVTHDWEQIRQNPYMATFRREVPELCRGCAYERSCQGGCKESGYAVFGDHQHPEPLLWLGIDPRARDGLPPDQDTVPASVVQV